MTSPAIRRFSSAALLVAAAAVATPTLIHSRVAHAFTLIEAAGWVMPPVGITLNQTAELCSVNWGDQTIAMQLSIVSGNVNLAAKTATLVPHATTCLTYIEKSAHTISAVVTTTGNTQADRAALESVVSSLQLKAASGLTFLLVRPALLPAVQ